LISIIKKQAKELFAELDRVSWSDKEKVLNATYSVVIISAIVGLFLWSMDWIISWGMKIILPHH